MAETIWVACLSGPESKRAAAEVALETAGIPLLPADHHAQMDWPRKLTPLPSGKQPGEPQAFLAVATPDIDRPVAAVERHGFVLRVHHPMPPEPEPSQATVIDELRVRVAALEARG